MPTKQRVWKSEARARACDTIIAGVASGKSLKAMCAPNTAGMPTDTTFDRWCEEDPDLAGRYARARDSRADVLVEEAIEIADNASNDWMKRNDPDNEGYNLNGEHIQRAKLRVDTRRWFASKLAPKKYGDKMTVDATVGLTVTLESDAEKL